MSDDDLYPVRPRDLQPGWYVPADGSIRAVGDTDERGTVITHVNGRGRPIESRWPDRPVMVRPLNDTQRLLVQRVAVVETAPPPVSTTANPGAVLLGHFTPGSAAWHEARATGLGGSEIAAVVGLSPYESRFSLYWRKMQRLAPIEVNDAMEWGARLEDAVCRKFCEGHPEYRNHGGGTWASVERPWQIANPDLLLSADDGLTAGALLEVKTSRWGDGYGSGVDEIPVHVRAQVLWYLDVFGFDRAHVAVLIAGSDYREYVIEHDRAESAHLRHQGRLFLDDLAAGVVPDIDESLPTYEAERELHPNITPDDIEIADELARFFCRSRDAYQAAQAAHQLAKNQVMDVLGDSKRARWGDFMIAQRQARGDGFPYLVAGRKLPDFSGVDPSNEGETA